MDTLYYDHGFDNCRIDILTVSTKFDEAYKCALEYQTKYALDCGIICDIPDMPKTEDELRQTFTEYGYIMNFNFGTLIDWVYDENLRVRVSKHRLAS